LRPGGRCGAERWAASAAPHLSQRCYRHLRSCNGRGVHLCRGPGRRRRTSRTCAGGRYVRGPFRGFPRRKTPLPALGRDDGLGPSRLPLRTPVRVRSCQNGRIPYREDDFPFGGENHRIYIISWRTTDLSCAVFLIMAAAHLRIAQAACCAPTRSGRARGRRCIPWHSLMRHVGSAAASKPIDRNSERVCRSGAVRAQYAEGIPAHRVRRHGQSPHPRRAVEPSRRHMAAARARIWLRYLSARKRQTTSSTIAAVWMRPYSSVARTRTR
jgi:hypothetical protein